MLNIAQKRYYANCYNCPIMYLRYVQHGLWLKFLRKGRGVEENVCGMDYYLI